MASTVLSTEILEVAAAFLTILFIEEGRELLTFNFPLTLLAMTKLLYKTSFTLLFTISIEKLFPGVIIVPEPETLPFIFISPERTSTSANFIE